MRKPGWYWVSKGGVWRCAYWDGGDWAFGESLYDDAAWDKIGPRIPTPDEPWQCVPGLDGVEIKALERFSETTLDDGTYDIGRDMIRRLADKGAIRHLSAGRYQLTQAGQAMLAAAPRP